MVDGGLSLRRWIIVEGMDGSGKSTVARWIKDIYEDRGDRVLVQIHPSDRWTGRVGRRCLQSKGIHMYVLSTFFFILDVLISLVHLKRQGDNYDDVVFVRYAMAAAYLPRRYVKLGYNTIVKVLPLPQRLLLVDVEPATALKRMSARNDEEEMFENIRDLTKVREKIMLISGGWKVLNNDGDERASRQQLERIVKEWDHLPPVG